MGFTFYVALYVLSLLTPMVPYPEYMHVSPACIRKKSRMGHRQGVRMVPHIIHTLREGVFNTYMNVRGVILYV